MKTQKLTCINAHVLGSDNETITLENDEVKVHLQIKDQLKFGAYEIGKEYSVSFGEQKKEAKKTAAKKQAETTESETK